MKKVLNYLNYAKYSWVTWLVVKAMMTLELGVFDWIFNWVCGMTAFINYGFLRVARLGFVLQQLTEPFWENFFFKQTLHDNYLYIVDFVLHIIFMLQDTYGRTVTNLKEMAIGDDIGILIIFMVICGDMAWIYRAYMIRGMYREVRKELEKQFYKDDFRNLNYFKWKKYNSDEETDIYMEVHETAMHFISRTNITTLSIAMEDTKTIKSIKCIIKEQLLKIKYEFSKRQKKGMESDNPKKVTLEASSGSTSSSASTASTASSASEAELKNWKIIKKPCKRNTTENKRKKFLIKSGPASATTQPKVCWTCQYPSCYLMKCSGCKKARYCGESCYTEDWERHKEWCKKKGEKKKIGNSAEIKNEDMDDEVD